MVDDEPVARRRLCRMLAEIPDVVVVGEADNGLDALAEIDRTLPDAVLLDIRMPGLDGLAVAKSRASLPPIIFTTAHDQHAVAAFEACAVDYLLKPVQRQRLERALARARLERGEHARVMKLLGELLDNQRGNEARVVAREGDTLRVFDASRIPRFYASDKYSVFCSEGREYLLEESLNNLEERLSDFVRVHRGELVSLKHVV
ncbi:MAG TPA: response regulator transcription factor, partial [Polyangiaceae bacterium]|nr:response regulator transcription factor [Polyangiaceae bacterium]